MSNFIYRLAISDDWDAAKKEGIYKGTKVDFDSGFIHLSTAAQMRETAALYFKGEKNLIALKIDANALGSLLKWEAAPTRPNAGLFPHIYGYLDVNQVVSVHPLPLNDQGVHQFGSDLE